MKPFGLAACLLLFLLVLGMPTGYSIDPLDARFEYSSEDVSQFTDFFTMDASAAGGGIESYNPSGQEPSSVYFGDRSTSYYSYQSTYSGANSLWIMGSSSWAQRVVCPLGAYLSLLAYTTAGGRADFYEIYPSGRLFRNSYNFYPGYSRLIVEADEVGRHILFFVLNNQPSNAVIVDVSSSIWPPAAGSGSSGWPSAGSARVIFSSSSLRGYSVFVDGSYVGGDGQGGDPLDGAYSLNVAGNQYHTLEISSGGQTYSEKGTFLSGYTYRLSI